MTTKRYLIFAPPTSALRVEAQIEASSRAQRGARVVRRTQSGRRVAHLAPQTASALARENPGVVVEEDHPLELYPMPEIPAVVAWQEMHQRKILVRGSSSSTRLKDVTIFAEAGGVAYKAKTDAKGRALLQAGSETIERLIVSPPHSYWSRVLTDVSMSESDELIVDLARLAPGGQPTWGHRVMGFDMLQGQPAGRGVRVAVIDSGIARVRDLSPVGGLNTLDGADPARWDVDEKGHGTHCAGVVAALANAAGITGGAPAAEVFSLKVFPGGFVSDLVEAVDWCVSNGIDVISMSLGSPQPSQILASALEQASARGITCVAAAGNNAGPVSFPASLPFVVAVSALGRAGTFPKESAHALRQTQFFDWGGQLFSASFTNHGPEVDLCAPGVAVLSTVPDGYAAWDGTSMACPFVSALAAVALWAFPNLRSGDASQSERLRSLLQASALPLGLPALIEGNGLPSVPRLFEAAPYFV